MTEEEFAAESAGASVERTIALATLRMCPRSKERGPSGHARTEGGAKSSRRTGANSGRRTQPTRSTEPDYARPAAWRRGKANSTVSGRRVRQHRSFAPRGKARPEKWRAEPRPEPDSGNPTVRDRRGASGNVASWSLISTRRARLISISTKATSAGRTKWDVRSWVG